MIPEVIKTDDKVFIQNIPPMKYGENMDNTFIRSAQLSVNALGENYTYDFLMGISGAAFRLHFHPDWCPSSVDATVGFDVSRVLFKSLGYKCELVKIDDNSFKDIRSLNKKIITQIDQGRPIVAINLKVCPDWGIITGYLKNKPGILCRTYFDENEEYSLAEHAPFLAFFLADKGESLNEDEVFFNSLKIAVKLAWIEKFEIYKSGFSAYEEWIKELKKMITSSDKKKLAERMEVNFVILNILLDSRRSAVRYLKNLQADKKLKKGKDVIDYYKEIVHLLETSQENLFNTSGSDPQKQMEEIIKKESDTLTNILDIEKKVIHVLEQEINF